MGFVEVLFIWLFTYELADFINLDGETVSNETQQSFVFYFLLFGYLLRAIARLTHINILVFFAVFPMLVVLIPFSYYVDPFTQISRFVNFPDIFTNFILL
mmetsp:Transcript_30354/g.34771  ORF Transcript_30354/g.34771 Transcript_30354/m.34771 type:complete len:100 (-) Transcript_30354:2009-2308(-)